MNWMELAQDRDHWRALVNELVNIPISSDLCYVTMETIWNNDMMNVKSIRVN